MTRTSSGLTTQTNAPAPVHTEVSGTLLALAGSLNRLFGTLSLRAMRASELVQALGIDTPLASRLMRIAQSNEPAEVIEFLPTLNQIRRAIEVASDRGDAQIAEHAMQVLDRLEQLVEEFGGDQRGFESIVSIISPGGVRRVELAQRRAAFRANAHLWGLSAECVVYLMILLPNREGDALDLHAIQGFVNARITRPTVRVTFGSRLRLTDAAGEQSRYEQRSGIRESKILSEFSTIGQTRLTEFPGKDGEHCTAIEFKGPRRSDAETFFLHKFVPSIVQTKSDGFANDNSFITWPCELLRKDVLVPQGLTDPQTLSVRMFARRDDPRNVFEMRPEDEVPLHDAPSASRVSTVLDLPGLDVFPRLGEMAQSIAGRHVARGLKFDVYRSEVQFPMMHSLHALRVKHVPTESMGTWEV